MTQKASKQKTNFTISPDGIWSNNFASISILNEIFKLKYRHDRSWLQSTEKNMFGPASMITDSIAQQDMKCNRLLRQVMMSQSKSGPELFWAKCSFVGQNTKRLLVAKVVNDLFFLTVMMSEFQTVFCFVVMTRANSFFCTYCYSSMAMAS